MIDESPILDMTGQPIKRDILREPQTAQTRYLYGTFAEHPTTRLTPARLQQILAAAETGDLSAQADLFTDMEERDAHIFAEMQKRKRALLTVPYEIVPPPNATPEEQADTRWIAEFITELDAWDDLLVDMMDALGQGFSNIEINWQLYGREWFPAEFNYRPPSWFQLSPVDQNQILLKTETGQGEALRPFGWIEHRHKSRSGYVARAGLMRTLSWPYIYRTFGGQSLAELLEIYGVPIRIGKYPSGVGKTDKAALMKAVTELGRYAGGIMPAEMTMEIKEASSGSHAPHMALAEWAEKAISKAVLGGTLTSQADGKTSTNALGEIHNDVRNDLLISDCKQVAATLRRDLFYPMIAINRRAAADPRRTPRIKFNVPDKSAEPASSASARGNADGSAAHLVAALVAALTSSGTGGGDPVQTGIDNAVTMLAGSPQAQDALIALLSPAVCTVPGAETPAALLAALAEAFPRMDPSLLASSLGDARNIARLVGQYAAQGE
ncbi:phage portal protein family protein [Salmonella enterica]